MVPTADPGTLDAAARALRQQADLLDSGASLTGAFAREASSSPWTGHAADRFRHTVTQDLSQSRSLAGELRSIAGMIEAGANKIRAYRAREAQLQALLDQTQQPQKQDAIKQQMAALHP